MLVEGKKTAIGLEREEKLNEIGFVWSVIKVPPREQCATPKSWAERLEFKAQHGRTVVPQHYFGLGNW